MKKSSSASGCHIHHNFFQKSAVKNVSCLLMSDLLLQPCWQPDFSLSLQCSHLRNCGELRVNLLKRVTRKLLMWVKWAALLLLRAMMADLMKMWPHFNHLTLWLLHQSSVASGNSWPRHSSRQWIHRCSHPVTPSKAVHRHPASGCLRCQHCYCHSPCSTQQQHFSYLYPWTLVCQKCFLNWSFNLNVRRKEQYFLVLNSLNNNFRKN